MDWPVATVLLGTLGTLAVGILKWVPRRGDYRVSEIGNGRIYARATDLAEFRARLVSLEQAHHVLRAELRADMKELQQMIRDAIKIDNRMYGLVTSVTVWATHQTRLFWLSTLDSRPSHERSRPYQRTPPCARLRTATQSPQLAHPPARAARRPARRSGRSRLRRCAARSGAARRLAHALDGHLRRKPRQRPSCPCWCSTSTKPKRTRSC